MTKLMQKAIDALTKLPEERQKELAGYILDPASQKPVKLTPEEKAALAESRAAARAGDFATNEEVEAITARLRSA